MNAMLVIKTANGYAVMPYTSDIPQADLPKLLISTHVSSSSWGRGQSVAQILEAHFEPPVEIKEAA